MTPRLRDVFPNGFVFEFITLGDGIWFLLEDRMPDGRTIYVKSIYRECVRFTLNPNKATRWPTIESCTNFVRGCLESGIGGASRLRAVEHCWM